MILTIISISLAGIMNAFMDRLSTAGEFQHSILKRYESRWFAPKVLTWRNKYKSGIPSLGSRFPFSTTWLVFLTDAWHFCKELQLICIYLALALNISIINSLPINFLEAANYPLARVLIDVLLFKAIMAGSFHIFYTNLLTMKFWKDLKSFLTEMNFFKGAIVIAPLFFLWILGAEALNTIDPRYSPTDGDTTFLGDIIMTITFFLTIVVLAWKNFRKPKTPNE